MGNYPWGRTHIKIKKEEKKKKEGGRKGRKGGGGGKGREELEAGWAAWRSAEGRQRRAGTCPGGTYLLISDPADRPQTTAGALSVPDVPALGCGARRPWSAPPTALTPGDPPPGASCLLSSVPLRKSWGGGRGGAFQAQHRLCQEAPLPEGWGGGAKRGTTPLSHGALGSDPRCLCESWAPWTLLCGFRRRLCCVGGGWAQPGAMTQVSCRQPSHTPGIELGSTLQRGQRSAPTHTHMHSHTCSQACAHRQTCAHSRAHVHTCTHTAITCTQIACMFMHICNEHIHICSAHVPHSCAHVHTRSYTHACAHTCSHTCAHMLTARTHCCSS